MTFRASISGDPPNPSSRGRYPRRKPTEPRSDQPQGTSDTGPPHDGAQGLQDVPRPKKSSLDFHRTAHSFPDYGSPKSLKGAVRMNPFRKLGSILSTPAHHVDTLNSNPGCPPPSKNIASTAGVPSSPKRQKKVHPSPRPRNRDSEVIEVDRDPISKTERHGSQSSLAHSTSPGVVEYQTVEASTKREGRSNRRTRQPPATLSSGTSDPRAQRVRPRETEPVEDFDSLGPPQTLTGEIRTVRLTSTLGQRPNAPVVRDAADRHILGPANRAHEPPPPVPSRGRKRSSREIADSIDDSDELAEEPTKGKPANPGAAPAAGKSTDHGTASLSTRGDLKPTKWQSKSSTVTFVVKAARCQPNLRYGLRDGESLCILKPTADSELRPFTEDGKKAASYDWLKVSSKTQRLSYSRDSPLVVIRQSTEQNLPTHIGALMMIAFLDTTQAAGFVDWVRANIQGIQIAEDGSRKLNAMWDKLGDEVSKARLHNVMRPSSAEKSTAVLTGSTGQLSPPATVQSNASPAGRTLLRRQMRVSTQQNRPSLLDLAVPSVLARPSPRFSRTQPPVLSPSPPAAIHRWSEENPDWARNWKMPLILARTTVDKEDIPRLDEGQCLNDNLIGYGLRYLFDKFKSRHEDLHKRVYLHNSFFYEKLKAGRGAINYDGVKNWTAKVDLLSYDYIVVPVNEHYHWWVAIICNPGKLDPDARKDSDKPEGPPDKPGPKADGESSDVEMTDLPPKQPDPPRASPPTDGAEIVKSDIVDLVSGEKDEGVELSSSPKARRTRKPRTAVKALNPKDPRIITLDSLGSTHPQAVAHLKKYILAEFKHKRNKEITETPQQLGMKAVNIPEQDNFCDCGVYLLGYIQEFVKDPDMFINTLLRKERPEWNFNPSELRELWRETILREQKIYQSEEVRKKREAALGAKPTPKPDALLSTQSSRDVSQSRNDAAEKRGSGAKSSEQPSSTSLGNALPSGIRLAEGSAAGPSPVRPITDGRNEAQSPPSTRQETSPQQPVPLSPAAQPESLDHDVMILPPRPQEEDAVMESIETADVVELPKQRTRTPDVDEVQFLGSLPSSSGPGADSDDTGDDDKVTEVDIPPAAFYAPAARGSRSGSARTTGTALSSPTFSGSRRKQTAGTRPRQYTRSRFQLRALSDDAEPTVMAAEVVRNSDPIDLT